MPVWIWLHQEMQSLLHSTNGIITVIIKNPFSLIIYFYCRSFAYYTVKVRMPVILTQTLDRLVREKNEIGKEYGEVNVGRNLKGQNEIFFSLYVGGTRGIERDYRGDF